MRHCSLVIVLLAMACGGQSGQPQQTAPAAPTASFPNISSIALMQHVQVLASDELEGRAPGSKGEDLTVAYLEEQFKKIGLKPGDAGRGTYIQNVPLVGITPDPAVTLVLNRGGRERRLKYLDDFVAWTKHVEPGAAVTNSELVFVGYGVVAPEFTWDDYKGQDVGGKTLVMLVNDPPVPDAGDPSRLDPKIFGGVAMTYYGRWTYKYEIGAQKKAAGVLIVHETGPAGYPWPVVQGFSGERFDLVTPDKNLGRSAMEGWITLDQAKAIFAAAGQDFDALKKRAATRDFAPVPLGTTASVTIKNALRTLNSRNVIGVLEGSDPKLKNEYVIYTAHWDHLGVGQPVNGDRIYNGAVDNATGVAGLLELARAFTQLMTPPKRSIVFLLVTAEEQGLIGSEHYATFPVYPLSRTLADINLDGMNVHGRTKDVTIVGLGMSDLDDYVRQVASEQGRVVRADAEPEKGFYYRSDHFNFAKKGVPALDPDDGVEYLGKPADYGRKVRDEYTEVYYHKPQDEIRSDWDLSGMVEDLQLFWMVGYRVAQADRYPQWKPGTEFKAIRDAQVKTTTK